MRWILIGASTIAAEHMIGAIRSQPGASVHRILSSSPGRAAEFAATHGIPHHGSDLAAALADPEAGAVYISTTNEQHRAQALAAIAAGKHVLCEKPLAMTAGEAAEMVLAARARGVTFATNHHLRCAGSHRAIRALIAGGRIGKVLSLRIFHAVQLPAHLQGWRINDAAAGGGVIADITVHNADTARFLLQDEPVSVVAKMTASGLGEGVEDSAMSIWTMSSGAMVFSHESFTHAFAGSGLELHGTAGSVFARGVMSQSPLGEVELVTAAGREAIPFTRDDLYATGLTAFLAATRGEGAPAASGEDGVRSLSIALAVREAARSGACCPVTFPEL